MFHSSYLAVQTFATVGLGDFAPPFFKPGRPLWYQAMGYFGAGLLAMCGLALLTSLLSALQLWASRKFDKIGTMRMTRLDRNMHELLQEIQHDVPVKRLTQIKCTSTPRFSKQSARLK